MSTETPTAILKRIGKTLLRLIVVPILPHMSLYRHDHASAGASGRV